MIKDEEQIAQEKQLKWDNFFMTMAYLVASMSKDQKTHIGAVIIGPNKEVRSVGFNSFPRGINDDLDQRQEKPEKYYWFEHGERNAIYNATLMGVSLKDCVLYTSGIPCMDCARGIVQSGIKEVVVDDAWNKTNSLKWQEHAQRTQQLFLEAGIGLRFWQGQLVPIVKFNGGEIIA